MTTFKPVARGEVEQTLFGSLDFLAHTLKNDLVSLNEAQITLSNGTSVQLLDVGVLLFTPIDSNNANSIIISAGVHGNETAPIEIVENMVNDIFSGKILVNQNLLVIIANPPSINAGSRFVKENMNRLFGNIPAVTSSRNYECVRAYRLMHHTAQFFEQATRQKYHFDLHTAIRSSEYQKFAISPNPYDQENLTKVFSFLERCGIEAVLLSDNKGATFSAYTSMKCKATSFTLELGKVHPFGRNNLMDFQSLTTCLTELIVANGDTDVIVNQEHEALPELFQVSQQVIKLSDSFRLCFASDIPNFTAFNEGEVLAKDVNYRYEVTSSSERIVFPNENVPNGHRALVIIKPLDEKTKSIL